MKEQKQVPEFNQDRYYIKNKETFQRQIQNLSRIDGSQFSAQETPRTNDDNQNTQKKARDTPMFANKDLHDSMVRNRNSLLHYTSQNTENNYSLGDNLNHKTGSNLFLNSYGHIDMGNQSHCQNQLSSSKNLQQRDEQDMEELLKSSNSALSDYNFLFDQIDQQMNLNTQTMIEELQKNLPDYLNTNQTQGTIRKDSNGFNSLVKGQQEGQDFQHRRDRNSFNKIEFPVQQKEPFREINQNAVLKRPLEQDEFEKMYGGQQFNQSEILNDISEEMISIEDTYKEMGLSKKSNSLSEEDELNQNKQNSKSMTIIEEEDFEESIAHLRLNSGTSNKLRSHSKPQLPEKKKSSLHQIQEHIQSSSTNQKNQHKESVETFGEVETNKNTSQTSDNYLDTDLNNQGQTTGPVSKTGMSTNPSQNQIVCDYSNITRANQNVQNQHDSVINVLAQAFCKSDLSANGTQTLDDIKDITLKSKTDMDGLLTQLSTPMSHLRQNTVQVYQKYSSNSTINQSKITNQRYQEEEKEVNTSISDIMSRHQARYQEAKAKIQPQKKEVEYIKLEPNQRTSTSANRRANFDQTQSLSELSEDTEAEQEPSYINRSFVSTQNVSQQYKTQRSGQKQKPFDFYTNEQQTTQHSNDKTSRYQKMQQSLGSSFNNQSTLMRNLQQEVKLGENEKLKLEKQILEQRIEFEREIKVREFQHSKQLKEKQQVIDDLMFKMKERDEMNDEKLENMRERMKRVEKQVYERVENDYSIILQEKEDKIFLLKHQISKLEQTINDQKQVVSKEREQFHQEQEGIKIRERQRLLEERTELRMKAQQENHKELNIFKENLDQEWEFKFHQLQQEFQQKYQTLKSQLNQEKQNYIQSKEQEFQQKYQDLVRNFEEEKLKNHSIMTQKIFEEVSQTLKERNKNQEHVKFETLKQSLEKSYKEMELILNNKYEAELARERKAKCKIELLNAQQEDEINQLKLQLEQKENKENLGKAMNGVKGDLNGGKCKKCDMLIIANGELLQKMKKLKQTNKQV